MTKKNLHQTLWPALGNQSPQDFLKKYWQKKPLLVRKAFPHFQDILSPDELAGLAMEPGCLARLVFEKGKKPWRVEKGPFQEKIFRELPKTHWSLLVSRVNEYLDQAASLLETFNFIPHWRLDDLMISFAPPHGSVGPHVDSYDVFLIQGLGRRRWQIQKKYDTTLVAGADLKVLKNFNPDESWELEPGDLLYLPPGVAHYGVALENCMTYSIGFRAPSHRNLLSDLFNIPQAWLSENLLSAHDQDILYRDPHRQVTHEPGLVDEDFIQNVRRLATSQLKDDSFVARFALRHLTQSSNPPERFSSVNPKSRMSLLTKLKNPKTRLVRTHLMPLAYLPLSSTEIALGIGGTIFELPIEVRPLLILLTQTREWSGAEICKALPKHASSQIEMTAIDLVYNLIKWKVLQYQ